MPLTKDKDIRPAGGLPVIMRALWETRDTKGPILELGVGYNTTLFLREACRDRKVVSVESAPHWFERFRELESPTHKFKLINNWAEYDTQCDHWDIIYIDHAGQGARGRSLAKLANKARIIICHDTEDPSYGYNFSRFKYRDDYVMYRPHTTVVSNEIDVSKWNLPRPVK